jgi:hypothetical protein
MENIDRGGPLSSTVQAPPPIDNHQYEDSRRESYPAIDRPPNLSRHETTRQNTDALQKPDSAKNDEDCGDAFFDWEQLGLSSANMCSSTKVHTERGAPKRGPESYSHDVTYNH